MDEINTRDEALSFSRDRIDEAKASLIAMWTAPNGCVYIESPERIRNIIADGSWR
jgi:hypothetical protein